MSKISFFSHLKPASFYRFGTGKKWQWNYEIWNSRFLASISCSFRTSIFCSFKTSFFCSFKTSFFCTFKTSIFCSFKTVKSKLFVTSFKIWNLEFGPHIWDLGLEAGIKASRLGYGPWGWGKGRYEGEEEGGGENSLYVWKHRSSTPLRPLPKRKTGALETETTTREIEYLVTQFWPRLRLGFNRPRFCH